MITLTNAWIRAYLQAQGLQAPAPDRLHLLGIRGMVPRTSTGVSLVENTPGLYNDTLLCFGTELVLFPATVDPGRHYTTNPLDPEGCAHLCDGGPYLYRIGTHRGKDALVQAAPVRYWRDADRDHARDRTPGEQRVRAGFIGLNLHRGGETLDVGAWSAGCQVIPVRNGAWERFWGRIEASDQREFRYWLIDGRAFAAWVDGK